MTMRLQQRGEQSPASAVVPSAVNEHKSVSLQVLITN